MRILLKKQEVPNGVLTTIWDSFSYEQDTNIEGHLDNRKTVEM
jgi:hypothetical protein